MTMTEEELFGAIQSEIDLCEETRIATNPSYAAKELSRLDLIDRYMFSRFRDGDTDSLGNQMVFYNISSFPVEVAAKMLDFDTKDILLKAEDDRYWETWLMEKELKFWLEDNKFGKFLNECAYKWPKDGHLIAKNVDDKIELVPLKNLRFRPNALELSCTPVIEKYEYMPDEFVALAKEKKWTDWELVETNPEKAQTGYFNKVDKITIFGAWFPKGFLKGDNNYFLVSYDGHILYESEEEPIYKELAWEKVAGRLLGRGVVEKLFNEQIYLNRIANYKADGLNWTSKHFFQTRDVSFKTNLLGNSDNGDVFITNDPIDPVLTEERNLAFYNQEEQRWQHNAYERAFSTGPVTGDWSPSGTRVGVSAIQAKMTAGFYDQKKEELGMFIKEIIWDWIIPQFKKDKKGQHSVMMKNLLSSEENAQKFFQLQLNYRLNKQMFGKIMPPEMKEMKKALIAEQLKSSEVEVPRGLYDDLEYKMTIVIDSENIDITAKMTTLQTMFQIIGSNPAVLQDKTSRNILAKMLNLAGFNPHDIFGTEEVQSVQGVSQMLQMKGGSIAAPAPSTLPTASSAQVKV